MKGQIERDLKPGGEEERNICILQMSFVQGSERLAGGFVKGASVRASKQEKQPIALFQDIRVTKSRCYGRSLLGAVPICWSIGPLS